MDESRSGRPVRHPDLRRKAGASMQLYWEDVHVGQELPPFVRKTDLSNWNRWTGYNDEYVAYHMEDEAARRDGQPGVFGHGRLRLSYLHSLLRGWMGDEGFIVRLSAQMRGVNFKNDVLTCSGKVRAKRIEDGQHLIDLELAITNQRGDNLTPGVATVRLPSRAPSL